jgi:hypothetical protein
MRALFLLPFVILALANASKAEPITPERWRQAYSACPGTIPALERARCMGMALAAGEACAGTVEERVTCPEGRIVKQANEIAQLKYELDKLNRPRVQLMDGQHLSQQ